MANPLDDIDLTLSIDDKKEYNKALKKLQIRLLALQQALHHSPHAVLMAFEGWDAAGKGGTIKRLTAPLDPRGFKVYSIGPPTEDEKRHQYMWRFWNRVPACGEMVIFDRSWYGRVLVERVEGFATNDEWKRAYEEINSFEHQLADAGILVLKFWMHISDEEQLRRFRERENDPLKSWKIGSEDWRNRNKRPHYLKATREMFQKTDTKHCPWRIIPAEHKWYGRVEVMKQVVQELEGMLGKPQLAAMTKQNSEDELVQDEAM